jgi:hypothetical protein
MPIQPVKGFVVSLGPAASVFTSVHGLKCVDKTLPSGTAWFIEETPLFVPADILYQRSTRRFVGLTYWMANSVRDYVRAAHLVASLDSSAVRLNDFSTDEMRFAYPALVQKES